MDDETHNNVLVKFLTGKIVKMVGEEIKKEETQKLVRENVILPIIHVIYKELYPYIYGFITVISFILLITLSTFLFFIFFYFKKL